MKSGLLISIILLMFILPSVSARVSYFQNKLFINNETIYSYRTVRNSAFFGYDKSLADYIKKDNPLEAYVDWRAYLQTWNENAGNRSIAYCNLTIYFLPHSSNNIQTLFNKVFYPNESDTDTVSNKYFFQLQDGDAVRTQADCIFNQYQSLNPVFDLDIPLDFSYNTPTWNCKACQLYEWSKQQITIKKAETLNDYTTNIVVYTKRLFQINYEIIYILFWIFTFIMFYLIISLLFTSVYWGYLYIKKWTRTF